MGRNHVRREEVALPEHNPDARKRVVEEGLMAYLADNRDAWTLDADGMWTRVKPRRGARVRSAQAGLLARMRALEAPER